MLQLISVDFCLSLLLLGVPVLASTPVAASASGEAQARRTHKATGRSRSPERESISGRIRFLLAHSPAIEHARIGFKFVDLTSGAVLAEQSPATFFTPASNAKLYTTAMALVRLGPDYRFRTELRTSAAWLPGQRSLPDLQIIGGGDPNLSGRTLPYAVDRPEGDSLAAVKQLADLLVQTGVQQITGDLTGVATRYPGPLYPDGWTLDDSVFDYGAPVSALAINDSTVTLILRPSDAGELAQVELRPATSHFIVENEVETDGSNQAHVKLFRAAGTNEVIVSGTIGNRFVQGGERFWREDLGVDDPALFTAETLRQLLQERGIFIGGISRAQYEGSSTSSPGTLLATRMSGPLAESLQVVNKVSQNLHAEMLLREVAAVRTSMGTLENGAKEREVFLREAGILPDASAFAIDDGSGLARQDLTTPDSTIALLRYMWNRPERAIWLRTLPIGDVDGSLQHRFTKIRGAGGIHAKTGSLSHVAALSGYIERHSLGPIAFSIMVNGATGRSVEVRDFIDRLCALFLDD